MKRGDVYWADLGPPAGRRPVLVLTRNAAIPVLSGIVVAPITTTIRDIASEVRIGKKEGLNALSVASCDNILTVPKEWFDPRRSGSLAPKRLGELDEALTFALGIVA